MLLFLLAKALASDHAQTSFEIVGNLSDLLLDVDFPLGSFCSERGLRGKFVQGIAFASVRIENRLVHAEALLLRGLVIF